MDGPECSLHFVPLTPRACCFQPMPQTSTPSLPSGRGGCILRSSHHASRHARRSLIKLLQTLSDSRPHDDPLMRVVTGARRNSAPGGGLARFACSLRPPPASELSHPASLVLWDAMLMSRWRSRLKFCWRTIHSWGCRLTCSAFYRLIVRN